MGLRMALRIPRQMVAVAALARDPAWGFGYPQTLVILKWDHASIHRYGPRGPGVPYVAMGDAARAMKRWLRSETIAMAAARMGKDPRTVWGWLLGRGMVKPAQRGNPRIFRHDPEFYDSLRDGETLRVGRPVRATLRSDRNKTT